MSEVIRADALSKVYNEGKLRTQVFEQLDFKVEAGESVAIVGASGAGKSTLLHILGGLDVPSAGEVYVQGHKMSELGDASRVAPVDKLSVVLVAILAALLLGERLSPAGWLGVVLIAAGAGLVAFAG